MTHEEKQLLLKDLCVRLPYKLHCRVFRLNGGIKENDDILYGVIGDNVVTLKSDKDECLMYYQIKPFLRPLSSMTKDEKAIYSNYKIVARGLGIVFEYNLDFVTEWLLKHHFDYRGLIEMGLALEAPEGMYNIKTE